VIRTITKKDNLNFCDYCERYGKSLFSDCSFSNLKKEFNLIIKTNKYCIIDEENEKFRGILIVEKIDKNYFIKTIYKNPKILDRLLNNLIWNFQKDLIFKLNDYKAVSTIKKYYFRFNGKENDNYIYVRKYFKKDKKNVNI